MITVQVEPFYEIMPELIEIFPRHWEELGLHRDKMPLAPQHGEYIRREAAGNLFVVIIRRDGKIVAYYSVQMAPGFHYETTITATMDMMYIVPEERNKGLAFPLFRAVERELKRRGVQLWYSGWKSGNPLGMPNLLQALGFGPADSYMAKWIGT